jgi:branched-chain amino acid transport system permease protein
MKILRSEPLKWALFFVVLLSLGLTVKNNYYLDVMICLVFWATAAQAWNIVGGFAGQISIGHVAFLGLGGYATALLTTRLGVTPWMGMLVGGMLAMSLAYLMGALTIRLRGPFFTLSTIVLSELLLILSVNFDGLTGGASGVDIEYDPAFMNMVFASYRSYFLLFLILLMVITAVTVYIKNSKIGYYLLSIREDESAAASLGVNVNRYKTYALLISAFFTGVAGSIQVQYFLFIDPHTAYSVEASIKMATLSIVGGVGTVAGPVVGAFLLSPVEIFLRSRLGGTYQGLYLLLYGAVMIVVVLVMPQGIVGAANQAFRLIRKRRSKPNER